MPKNSDTATDDALLTPDAGGRELAGVIKSAARVLELFEFFAECRRPMSVTDVVRGLDYPQSSASALLKSLTKLGYLDYDRFERLYVPTLRVALFGGWVQDQLFSQRSLSHLIDDVHAASKGQAVILGMQNDIYVQYIHLAQLSRQDLPTWYIKPGSLRPLCRSATGRILLSRKTDVEVQQLLWRINAEEAPEHRLQVGDLLKELEKIRQDGYAYTEGTVKTDSGVIAVEMPTPPSQPPMALGIGGPIETLRREKNRYLDLLRQALQPYRARGPTNRS
jgi:DNA-binding IclR family transcriptional regulator